MDWLAACCCYTGLPAGKWIVNSGNKKSLNLYVSLEWVRWWFDSCFWVHSPEIKLFFTNIIRFSSVPQTFLGFVRLRRRPHHRSGLNKLRSRNSFTSAAQCWKAKHSGLFWTWTDTNAELCWALFRGFSGAGWKWAEGCRSPSVVAAACSALILSEALAALITAADRGEDFITATAR